MWHLIDCIVFGLWSKIINIYYLCYFLVSDIFSEHVSFIELLDTEIPLRDCAI